MSFNKFKNNSNCVCGKDYSPTTNIHGDITVNEKTGIPVKLLGGACSTCKRNKSLIVSDQTINGEGLGDFFLKNPARALEIAANFGTAAASKNPRMIAATAPDIIKFVHQGKGLYLGKIH